MLFYDVEKLNDFQSSIHKKSNTALIQPELSIPKSEATQEYELELEPSRTLKM